MAAPTGNKFAVGNNGGRPPIFDTPEQLIDECEGYFKWCEGESKDVEVTVEDDQGNKTKETRKEWVRYPEHTTITGLSIYLGFADRSTLYDYEKKKEFSHVIKRAMQLIENGYEKALRGDKPTGSIFALKNMGWKDKTEVDSNVNITNEVFKIGDTEIHL